MLKQLLFNFFVLTSLAGCNSERIIPETSRSDPSEQISGANLMTERNDAWQKEWDARLAALEHKFGDSEDKIATSPVPIYLGGGADVLLFKKHLDGVVYVTAGLIGDGRQKKTELGEYELMMCFREENDWAPSLLSRLAPYTFESALHPSDTMEIGPALPENSNIAALLFVPYAKINLNDKDAGVLLCMGITIEELEECKRNGSSAVLAMLKTAGIFPYTDIMRGCVLGK
ncbi:MAG: suppressor of fused domain protein [Planctomycetaceae bacterium]